MEIDHLQKSRIFSGMSELEFSSALAALQAREKRYQKGQTILNAGDYTDRLGLVLAGSVTIESNDAWGNRTILSHVGKGQFFAESYALLPDEPLLVDVVANEDCRVVFLRVGGVQALSNLSEPWVGRFTANLLAISALQNLHLSGRSFHTAPKTVRGRVMAYLNTLSLQTQRREFDIPFDRQQLADYLNVDRTALSKELGRMQKEGLIRFRKNHFSIQTE
jgi:CRP-like cAMP-binding protein